MSDGQSKKLIKILFVATFILSSLTITHIHNETCSYDPETGTGCIHESDSNVNPKNENKPVG